MNKVFFKAAIIVSIVLLFTSLSMAKEMNNSPFGVLEFLSWDYSWSNYKYAKEQDLVRVVRLMREAGVSFVRMDFLWEDIEPQEREFNFAKYDYIVSLLVKNKINILGLLNYSAPWAAFDYGQWNSPPKYNRLFVKYAVKVIARYKNKIKYWEVWNEPDSNTYWSKQDGLKSYCGLLKDVYVAAKKTDPGCKILNGGLANGISSVNRLYDNGAKDYFDILNIHYFDTPLHEDAIKRVRAFPKLAYKVMSKNGDQDKKIWITEIGCPGIKKGKEVNNWWLGENPGEKEQAEWLKEIFQTLLKDKNVEKIFWAFFRDCDGHWNNGTDYLGLVRWDFSKKPGFEAYKKTAQEWGK